MVEELEDRNCSIVSDLHHPGFFNPAGVASLLREVGIDVPLERSPNAVLGLHSLLLDLGLSLPVNRVEGKVLRE